MDVRSSPLTCKLFATLLVSSQVVDMSELASATSTVSKSVASELVSTWHGKMGTYGKGVNSMANVGTLQVLISTCNHLAKLAK